MKDTQNDLRNREIKPTLQNGFIISEYLKIQIKDSMNKKRTYAEDLINELEGRK